MNNMTKKTDAYFVHQIIYLQYLEHGERGGFGLLVM